MDKNLHWVNEGHWNGWGASHISTWEVDRLQVEENNQVLLIYISQYISLWILVITGNLAALVNMEVFSNGKK